MALGKGAGGITDGNSPCKSPSGTSPRGSSGTSWVAGKQQEWTLAVSTEKIVGKNQMVTWFSYSG